MLVDDDVFTDFVRAHSTRLARVALLLTGGAEAAEDLLQSALAATYVRWPALADLREAETFLRRQLTITHAHWRRRLSNTEVLSAMPARTVAPVSDADAEQRHEVLEALRALAPRQRAVIVLRYYEDLSEAQIAQVLGISPGSVKAHASRGVQRLRALLSTEADNRSDPARVAVR